MAPKGSSNPLPLQEYRPKERAFWACEWDCTERTREQVRLLVGRAGCRVEFEPCGDKLVATVRQAQGKRSFADPCVLMAWGDGYVRSRQVAAFALEYEAAGDREEARLLALDVMRHGRAVMRDGKHVPLEDVFIAADGEILVSREKIP